MTNIVQDRMASLANQLSAAVLGTVAEVTAFPSESLMLDVRHGGREFVMAYSPSDGFGVIELDSNSGPNAGFIVGYRYRFREFEPAADRLRQLIVGNEPVALPELNLVVISACDLDAAHEFYCTLGLTFVTEQHGNGPRHYAATCGTTIFELYPCSDSRPASPARIGFQVTRVDRTVESLQRAGATILSQPKDSPWGRRAVVEDPDGNRVELTQRVTEN